MSVEGASPHPLQGDDMINEPLAASQPKWGDQAQLPPFQIPPHRDHPERHRQHDLSPPSSLDGSEHSISLLHPGVPEGVFSRRKNDQNRPGNTDMNEVLLAFENANAQLSTDLERSQKKWQGDAEKIISAGLKQVVETRHDGYDERVDEIKREFQHVIHQSQQELGTQYHQNSNDVKMEVQRTIQQSQQKIETKYAEDNKNLMESIKYSHGQLCKTLKGNNDQLISTLVDQQHEAIGMSDHNRESITTTMHRQDTDIKETIYVLKKQVTDSIDILSKTVSEMSVNLVKSQNQFMQSVMQQQESFMQQQQNLYTCHTKTEVPSLELSKMSGQSVTGITRIKKNKSARTKRKNPVVSETEDESSENDSDESITDQTDTEESDTNFDRASRGSHKQKAHRSRKYSTYNGTKNFRVWYKQFRFAAKGLPREEKLEALLQVMRDGAAEFVFDQLTSKTIKNYHRVVEELAHRYRKVENPKTYGAMFSKRNQKTGEALEEFAADLKRLYDKAHPARNKKTRREDLLRKFLDGVSDKEASSQVEFVKVMKDIDSAVEEVVLYQQLHKASKSRSARVQGESEFEREGEDEEIRFANRGPGRPQRYKPNPEQTRFPRNDIGSPHFSGNTGMVQDRGSLGHTQNTAGLAGSQNHSNPNPQGNRANQNSYHGFGSQTPTQYGQKYHARGQHQYGQGYDMQNSQYGQNYNSRNQNQTTRGYNPQSSAPYGQNMAGDQPRGYRPPPICYRCNEVGHTSKSCTAVLMVYPGNQPQSTSQVAPKTQFQASQQNQQVQQAPRDELPYRVSQASPSTFGSGQNVQTGQPQWSTGVISAAQINDNQNMPDMTTQDTATPGQSN